MKSSTAGNGGGRWSVEEKLRIVAESREPGSSVGGVAARHDVYPNLLSTRRNLERRGRLVPASPTRFVPIHLIETAPPPVATSPQATMRPATDGIEITLPDGRRQFDHAASRDSGVARMIAPPSGIRIWLATGVTDMRRGMNGLALQVQQSLSRDPHAGDLYVFRGKRGDL